MSLFDSPLTSAELSAAHSVNAMACQKEMYAMVQAKKDMRLSTPEEREAIQSCVMKNYQKTSEKCEDFLVPLRDCYQKCGRRVIKCVDMKKPLEECWAKNVMLAPAESSS